MSCECPYPDDSCDEMSYVTNVIVTCAHCDAVQFTERWSADHDQHFKDVTQHAGGGKPMEIVVLLAGFNYLDVEEVVKVVKSHRWRFPESVSILSKEEFGSRMLFDLGHTISQRIDIKKRLDLVVESDI